MNEEQVDITKFHGPMKHEVTPPTKHCINLWWPGALGKTRQCVATEDAG